MQDRKEVFARFVAKFVDWTDVNAGGSVWKDPYSMPKHDRFDTKDFMDYTKLLQEKL